MDVPWLTVVLVAGGVASGASLLLIAALVWCACRWHYMQMAKCRGDDEETDPLSPFIPLPQGPPLVGR